MHALKAGMPLLLLFFSAPALAAEPESPWTLGVLASIAALGIGGLAAILGLWIGRDHSRPISFAFAMTALISAAIMVGMTQSYLDEVDAIQKRQDLERMMGMVSEIAVATGDQDLANIISAQGGPTLDIPAPAPPPPEPAPAADGPAEEEE